MRCNTLRTVMFALVSALALAMMLAWTLAAEAPSQGETPARSNAAQPAAAWHPGVVTYTFDLNNMGWRSRDVYGDFAPAPWANGAISQHLSNVGGDGYPEDFAVFVGPRLDPALSGTGGSIAFTHTVTGDIPQLLFSVCLRFSAPGVIPSGKLPCTAWRPVVPGPVTLPLVADGTWGVYDYISIPLSFPPGPGTPLTKEQMAAILKAFRYINIHYVTITNQCSSTHAGCVAYATVKLDDVRLEVTAAGGKLGAASLYAQDGNSVLFYAALKQSDGQPIRSSREVTMTLTGKEGPLRMYDEPYAGDVNPGDGVYSRSEYLLGEGPKKATLYYRGDELDTITVTVTAHPHMVVLTDIQALYQQFLNTGMTPGQDYDGDGEIDFYQMLGRLAEYAAAHKGVVYDVWDNIDTLSGFPVNYAELQFAGNDPATNRFRMAALIDQALSRMHRESEHTISDVVIVGADDVIPFYRIKNSSPQKINLDEGIDTPTALDLAAGYIVSDVPYGTVDYENQEAVLRPSPQIPVGRVTAVIPIGMIDRLEAYAKPVVLDPREGSAALFVPADADVQWSWFDRNVWTPIFTSHYRLLDYRTAPPFLPGYYRYNGALVKWAKDSVLSALGATDLTVLATHGDNRCDATMQPDLICGSDYGGLERIGGRLYVVNATLSGFSPAFYSASGNRGPFNAAIPRWLQSVHRTQVGTTWVALGYNDTNGLSDYLLSNFVAQALDDGNATLGDAFVHAWDGFWTSSGGGTAYARSASYALILWGLPTQVIQHWSPSEAQAAEALGATDTPASITAGRSFTVEVSVPAFRTDADASGALLVRPANGGTSYAEGPGLPLLPQVIRRFVLPPAASDIRVTEEPAARVTQLFGAARLQTAQLHADCDTTCTVGGLAAGSALTGTYPSRAFDTEVQQRPDETVLTLAAVPARYTPDGQLTLFTRMRFTVAYTLPAAPAAAITGLTINNGQPVRAGTAAVPLAVNVTSDAARPVSVTYSIVNPSGLALGGGQATANLPRGASRVTLALDATRWTPGPKVVSVAVADANGVLDASSAGIQVLGLRIEADAGSAPAGAVVTLTVRAWDENGAAATGLAARLAVQLDGATRAVSFAEGPAGRYRGLLQTGGLSAGAHQAMIAATDARGLRAEAWTGFVIAATRSTYLPIVMRR